MSSRDSGIDTSGMEFLYNPRSIAIVGASRKRLKPGGRPLVALRERGYAGEIFAVNPLYDEIDGTPCYPSLLDIPEPVDLAVISVPAAGVLEVLRDCVTKGVRAAVVFTAGFSEMDEAGRILQEELAELARQSGLRVLGPNCLGLINVTNSVMASFAHIMDLEPVSRPTLAFVTQSGAFGAMIYAEATAAGVGFSSFTSVGNEAVTEFADYVGYLLQEPQAEVIGGYLEGARDGEKLRRVAQAALEIGKPILILKVGRTGAGARAASSHTGSLAGDDEIYDAFFRQMGIVRIESLSELTAFAILHRSGRSFEGERIAILSGSGGHGVMLADKCESLGLRVPEIRGATREKLEQALPPFGSARNPIDLTAQAASDTSMPGKCLRALVEDESTDIILMHAFFQEKSGVDLAHELIEAYESTNKPIVLLARQRGESEGERRALEMVTNAGIPIVPDGAEAAQAVAHLAWYQRKARRVQEQATSDEEPQTPPRPEADTLLAGTDPLLELECKQILSEYGIPVTREALAGSADEAVRLASELGYPVALKVQSPQILHKTEAGGIELELESEDEVRRAHDEILERARRFAPDAEIRGVLVQEMVTDGVEIIIGTTKDPVFGPVVMFGLGGIFVEALKDVSFRVAPLTRADAEEMIDEIRGHRVLEGLRGKPPLDREALIAAILSVSQLVTRHRDRIEELDINPLLLFPKGARAVDALITRSEEPTG